MRGLKSQWRIHQLSHQKNCGTSKVDLPFEFRVLEICQKFVCKCLESKVRDELEHLLDDDMDMAEMYLTYKHKKWHAEEPEPKDDAEDDSDEDGGGGNRSSSADLSGQKPKVEELEMLLEAYFTQLEGALSKLSKLSTELTLDLSLQLIDLWLLRLDQMKDASRGTLLLFMQRLVASRGTLLLPCSVNCH